MLRASELCFNQMYRIFNNKFHIPKQRLVVRLTLSPNFQILPCKIWMFPHLAKDILFSAKIPKFTNIAFLIAYTQTLSSDQKYKPAVN